MSSAIGLFVTNLAYGTIISSALILLIISLKRLVNKYIGAIRSYNLDIMLGFMLILPFLQGPILSPIRHITEPFGYSGYQKTMSKSVQRLYDGMQQINVNPNWMQDYTESTFQQLPEMWFLVPLGIWIVGMIVMLITMLVNILKVRQIIGSSSEVQDPDLIGIFEDCKRRTQVRGKVLLVESPLIDSPSVIGTFKRYIIFPACTILHLTAEEIELILLHELCHIRKGDIWINYWMSGLRVLYWFNPIIHFFLKEMRMNREMACDGSVLQLIDRTQVHEYGKTIIRFADFVLSAGRESITTNISGSMNQIRRRIISITDFQKERGKTLRLGKLLSILLGLFILLQSPLLAYTLPDTRYEFQGKNIHYEDLSMYFSQLDGCFVLYDLKADQYNIYNPQKSVIRVSPNSTYKPYSALFGLENGVIDSIGFEEWDQTEYLYPEWNQSHTLQTAMQYSVSWYFQDMDQKVGLKGLSDGFHQILYGNEDLSGGIESYWAQSSLLISPIEQVELLSRLYTNSLSFQESNMEIVKRAMIISEDDDAILSGKTGTGTVNRRDVNGWFIGYVEKEGNTYIFATNVTGTDGAKGSTAAQITLSILDDKGIYKDNP